MGTCFVHKLLQDQVSFCPLSDSINSLLSASLKTDVACQRLNFAVNGD